MSCTTADDDYIQYNGYQFEVTTGNLEWRTNHKRSLTENFGYDELNRLTEVTGATTMDIGYKGSIGTNTNGNIATKTNIGTYDYLLPQPHAVSKITGPGTEISGVPQYIHYTPFNKIDTITQGIYELDVVYDPFNGRRKTVLKENSAVKTTKYFVGNYEEVTKSSITKQRHFISSPSGLIAVMEREGTTDTMYYVHTDYLGSIEYITDSTGTKVEELSYDAWGRLRNPADWSDKGGITPKFDRGYTTHEHLPEFSLVNMNGRVYDPALGRMLSPDNYVQAAGFTQGFNRYSYALNNPLIYTDPSGYRFRLFDIFKSFFGTHPVTSDVYNGNQSAFDRQLDTYSDTWMEVGHTVTMTVATLGGAPAWMMGGYDYLYNGSQGDWGHWGSLIPVAAGGLNFAVNHGLIDFSSQNLVIDDFLGFNYRINNSGPDQIWYSNSFEKLGNLVSNASRTASFFTDLLRPTNGQGRPPRISKYVDESMTDQIINWMEYIEANPKAEIYYNEMIAPDLFSNVTYREGKGFLNAVSGRESVYGGVEYTIINPMTTNRNFPIAGVEPTQMGNRLSIRQYPTCGNCRGSDFVTINIFNNGSYMSILDRIRIK